MDWHSIEQNISDALKIDFKLDDHSNMGGGCTKRNVLERNDRSATRMFLGSMLPGIRV